MQKTEVEELKLETLQIFIQKFLYTKISSELVRKKHMNLYLSQKKIDKRENL